jgi:Icc-related predicted phosphoesterase
MRILAFADAHGTLPDLEALGLLNGVDLVLIAGDLCCDYEQLTINHRMALQRFFLENDFRVWCEMVKIPVYLTLGNHDLVDKFEPAPNLQYGSERIVDDILLFSWTPFFSPHWAYTGDEGEIEARILDALEENRPRIWLTHGPPFGCCDEDNAELVLAPENLGSRALRAAILEYQPELVVCGHIHSAAGWGKLGYTRVQNVTLVDDDMKICRNPALIEL